jgi:L,D-peptidoglycan transpeptidase YkuD (ErfK/YbiS/YcfS/YnhG family)
MRKSAPDFMDLFVIDASTLRVDGVDYACAIGKGGFVEAQAKREGDGKTPKGSYALRECWYRADKMDAPRTALPLRVIEEADGWCDAPDHAAYNRHVRLPFAASHERLWRDEDGCYDLIVPLGYNDDPVVAGRGSAIFLHVAKPAYSGTEGCVALSPVDLFGLLPLLSVGSQIHILADKTR